MKHAFLKLCIALKYVQYIGFNVKGDICPVYKLLPFELILHVYKIIKI